MQHSSGARSSGLIWAFVFTNLCGACGSEGAAPTLGGGAVGSAGTSAGGASSGGSSSGANATGGAAGSVVGGSGVGGASGSAAGGAGAGSAGVAGTAGMSNGGGGGLEWPNAESSANSDPWLVEHHDQVTKLRPRVLVLHAWNKRSLKEVEDKAKALVFALNEGSRYHGYKEPNAPAFLDYQIFKIVDMTDDSGAKFGQAWPLTGGDFNYAAIFTQTFADIIGVKDAQNHNQTLCELFERGVINEVWTVGDSQVVFETKARAQVYDDNLKPIAGNFTNCGGNGCYDPGEDGKCAVTVRLTQLNTERGPGCDVHGAGHAMESMRRTIPYWGKNTARFWNFEMERQYGVSFDSFYECDYGPPCVRYLSQDHIANEPGFASFDITNWGKGCGNVHFSPNSTYHYDYEKNNGVTASTSCENYGFGNGEGGEDLRSPYSYETVRKLNEDPRFNDCGGGWQIYMRQSFPGYGNQAKGLDGKPMKNWWPFLFY